MYMSTVTPNYQRCEFVLGETGSQPLFLMTRGPHYLLCRSGKEEACNFVFPVSLTETRYYKFMAKMFADYLT